MNIFFSVVTVIVFGIIGFFATVVVSFGRGLEFYPYFLPVLTIGIIAIAILSIYGQTKKKVVKNSAIGFLLIMCLTVAGYEGYQAYAKSLEVVSTQDTDLTFYQPFMKGSKVVKLDETSTYRLTDTDRLPKLDGATALYPVYAGFVQAVYPEKNYNPYDSEVVSSQTDEAFQRLVRGEVDIAFLAEPSEEQMKLATNAGVDLTLTPIGREAFVFFVHQKNPVNSLTVQDVQGIYSGEITNWKEVGGEGKSIRAFQRPEGSGSQSALIRFMGDTPLMEPPTEDIADAMGGIIREVTTYQNRTNAIGYSFRHFSQEMVEKGKIKHLAINGVAPTKEHIQDESYPVVASFYAITAGSDNPHIDEFIEWMQSEQGQKIVEETGYVPLR